MIIPISNKILDNFYMIHKEYLINTEYYEELSGKQEYRLYSYLTTFFDNINILDIGTLEGRSAIALSHNETNQVISYDIRNHINNDTYKLYSKPNVSFRVKNVLDDLTQDFIKDVRIVMIDIDHYGTIEEKIINRLIESGFSGIIILDDIYHPDISMKEPMLKLWNNIKEKKYDFTQYGHWSGTGVILVNTNVDFSFD
jgi:predicted O-methyltransferase YrrM